MLHKNLTLAERHPAHSYEYANSTNRLAATGFTASDLGKLAWQQDNNTFWVLTATTPTWVAFGTSGTWGGINGTLSDQSDLNSALAGKSNTAHNHTGVYEPADATILKDADIGVNVAAQVHNHAGVYEPADATILKDADIGVNVAAQAHNHTGVYEPADATILKDADIGVSVSAQGHNHTGVYEPADATILKDADIGVNVAAQAHNHTGVYEPADATILKDADIGVNVAAQGHSHIISNVTNLQNTLDGKNNITGFPVTSGDVYECTLSYTEGTRTITLTPTGSTFDVYNAGVKTTKTGVQTIQHAATQGQHFVYYNSSGTLVTGTSPWNLLIDAPVAFIFWDSTNSRGICFEERHHAGRDLYWHRNQHQAEGTKITGTGFGVTGHTLNNGSDDASVTFAIASGRVEDEDIRVDTTSLADGGPYTLLYRSGASGDWVIDRSLVRPFLDSGTALQYNQNTGATWQRTIVPEDAFVNYWIFALTSITASDQIVIIPGQATYATDILAHAETVASIAWGSVPFQEMGPLYQVTLKYNANNPAPYTNTAKCAIVRIARIIGTFASITQAAQADHGALAGLTDDDHIQYALTNPTYTALAYNNGGTTTILLDGRTEVYSTTAVTGSTTWAFSGAAASGKVSSVVLELTNGGSQTQTWPASVKWDAGTAPTLTAAGLDILTFYTRDGGTTWRGFLAAADSK